MSQKKHKIVLILSIVIFLSFCVAAGLYIGVPMIRLANHPELFRSWVDSHGFLGRLAFVAMVTIQVLVAFIPGEPVELLAGYAFGAVEGSILALLGIELGSWMVFALVRRFGVEIVEVFFHKDKLREIGFLKNPQKARILAFILMSIPGTPKDFLSYFAGLTPLRVWEWLGIVAIARLPSLLTSTITGAAAGEKKYLLSAVMLGITLLMSFFGVLYYHRIKARENQNV